MRNYQIKEFGFGRKIDYIKINFYIMYKKLLEYKTNFWSSFITEMIYFITTFLFFSIIINSLEIVVWEIKDYVIYFLLSALIEAIVGTFLWKEPLFNEIAKGKINNLLIKPNNSFFLYYFSELATPAIVFVFIDLITLLFVKFYYEISIQNIFLTIVTFISILILRFSAITFFNSLDFFLKGISINFIIMYNSINYYFDTYPYFFFEKITFKFFLNFFSTFLIGLILVPLIIGYQIENLKFKILGLLILNGVLIFLNIILWKKGIKKYEAFG